MDEIDEFHAHRDQIGLSSKHVHAADDVDYDDDDEEVLGLNTRGFDDEDDESGEEDEGEVR